MSSNWWCVREQSSAVEVCTVHSRELRLKYTRTIPVPSYSRATSAMNSASARYCTALNAIEII